MNLKKVTVRLRLCLAGLVFVSMCYFTGFSNHWKNQMWKPMDPITKTAEVWVPPEATFITFPPSPGAETTILANVLWSKQKRRDVDFETMQKMAAGGNDYQLVVFMMPENDPRKVGYYLPVGEVVFQATYDPLKFIPREGHVTELYFGLVRVWSENQRVHFRYEKLDKNVYGAALVTFIAFAIVSLIAQFLLWWPCVRLYIWLVAMKMRFKRRTAS